MAALPGPSLDGGRGGPARRTEAEPEEAPREVVVLADPGGRGRGGAGRGEGFRVRCAAGEEEEAGEAPRAARGSSGHSPWARFTLVAFVLKPPSLKGLSGFPFAN